MAKEFISTKKVDTTMEPGWMTKRVDKENDCTLMGTNIQENGKMTRRVVVEFIFIKKVPLKINIFHHASFL